ncbi:UDP-N-acetylmuramoyl-L-alanine--D-glutamate ligase [Citromicrobium bathyomarinum]
MILSPAWKGRKYAVLGLARTGRATVEALLAAGAEVTAWDSNEDAREAFAGRVTLADPVETDLTGFEAVLVTPGVPLNTHPIKPHADRFGVPVIGDIELFAQAREHLPPHKVVGITGTNGKSTTTALTHHILKTAGVPTTMGGNIGLPILEQEPLPEGGVYVLELSSYQIDLTFSLDCDVAVLTNISPDHLDRYEDFDAYEFAKARLFGMQSEDKWAIWWPESDLASVGISRLTDVFDDGRLPLRANSNGSYPSPEDLIPYLSPSLSGPHNSYNASKAMLASQIVGVKEDVALDALRTFPGLPHRMERVGERAGVLYVNDSKATNTAAAAPALAAFEKIHWIVGGQAKEPGLGETEQHIGHVTGAYTIGEAGDAFADALAPHCPVSRCGTLDIAVYTAALAAKPGDTVLLSPACASFDQFRDFEDRGDRFRALVHALADSEATP